MGRLPERRAVDQGGLRQLRRRLVVRLSRQAAQIVTSTGWAGASSDARGTTAVAAVRRQAWSHHSRLFRTALLGPGCATSPGSGRSWSWLPSAWRPPINLAVVATAPERAVAPGQACDEAPGWARCHLCQDLTASKAYTPMLLGEILDKKDVNFGGRDEQARRAEPWLVVASGRHKGQEVLKTPRKPPWRAHAAKLSWQVMRRPCKGRQGQSEADRGQWDAWQDQARAADTAAVGSYHGRGVWLGDAFFLDLQRWATSPRGRSRETVPTAARWQNGWGFVLYLDGQAPCPLYRPAGVHLRPRDHGPGPAPS